MMIRSLFLLSLSYLTSNGAEGYVIPPPTAISSSKLRINGVHRSFSSNAFSPSFAIYKGMKDTPSPNILSGRVAAAAKKSSSQLYYMQGKVNIEELKNSKPQVYPERWIMLGYLSILALLSDWVCFSIAATPSSFETAFPGHSAASIIDIFLFTNVASCFLVTDTIQKYGLEAAIKGAALLMAVGCVFRSGIPYITPVDNLGLVPYWSLLAGTIFVGAAQPFFQCTPPLLSAIWFASRERATSTAVALNFNQIGIATAFLVGGTMATTAAGLASYFTLISGFSVVVALGTLLQFKNNPPIPPSSSELEKLINGETEPPFLESVKQFFSTPGFGGPLTAFICSISITNIVGAFIDEVLERGGITSQSTINLAGAGFEIAILVGGIIIGGYVDRTKKYKDITLKALLFTILILIPLGLTEHAIGQEPILLILALLGLGMAAGPVQPISAELAVDVTYPGDETAVESTQQIGGNLVSALLVPVAEWASKIDIEIFPSDPTLESDIRGDVILLMAIAIATFIFYSGFDAPLRRTIADCDDDDACDFPELNQDEVVADDTISAGLEKIRSTFK